MVLVSHSLIVNDRPSKSTLAHSCPFVHHSPMSDDPLLDPLAILYRALREPIGLLMATPDFDRAREILYAVRARSGDARLKVLALRAAGEPFADETSEDGHVANLLIVKAKT
jgi:hypothetical protein